MFNTDAIINVVCKRKPLFWSYQPHSQTYRVAPCLSHDGTCQVWWFNGNNIYQQKQNIHIYTSSAKLTSLLPDKNQVKISILCEMYCIYFFNLIFLWQTFVILPYIRVHIHTSTPSHLFFPFSLSFCLYIYIYMHIYKTMTPIHI